MKPLTDEQIREYARRFLYKEGKTEIDHNATVSRGDDPGAYVQAWVWVPEDSVREMLRADKAKRKEV